MELPSAPHVCADGRVWPGRPPALSSGPLLTQPQERVPRGGPHHVRPGVPHLPASRSIAAHRRWRRVDRFDSKDQRWPSLRGSVRRLSVGWLGPYGTAADDVASRKVGDARSADGFDTAGGVWIVSSKRAIPLPLLPAVRKSQVPVDVTARLEGDGVDRLRDGGHDTVKHGGD